MSGHLKFEQQEVERIYSPVDIIERYEVVLSGPQCEHVYIYSIKQAFFQSPDLYPEGTAADGIFNNGLYRAYREGYPGHPEKGWYGDDSDDDFSHFVFRNDRVSVRFRSSGFSNDFFMVAFLTVRTIGTCSIL